MKSGNRNAEARVLPGFSGCIICSGATGITVPSPLWPQEQVGRYTQIASMIAFSVALGRMAFVVFTSSGW